MNACACCRDYGHAHNNYPCITCGHTKEHQMTATKTPADTWDGEPCDHNGQPCSHAWPGCSCGCAECAARASGDLEDAC